MTEIPSYAIEITTTPYIGYAQAFNKIPFITRIVITSANHAYLRDVQVELRVRTAAGDISQPALVTIEQLGKTHIYEEDAFDASGSLKPTFDGAALNTLLVIDSIQHGTVEVTLTHAETLIGRGVATIMVVPARVWAWDHPKNSTAANLAAYVLHYHPVIEQLIDQARNNLRKQLLPDSFEGYQGDATAVERQVKAIYDAVLQQNITYINPPASWDSKVLMIQAENQSSQYIRTPELVMERKFGTCIDTTILFAAILEHIGLFPVIFIIPRHAFVGYWRMNRMLDQSVMPLNEVVNYIDTNKIGLIETTAVTSGKSFVESQLAASQRIAAIGALSVASDAVCIDVVQARILQNISPIPSRIAQPNGEIVVIHPPKIIYRTAVVRGNDAKGAVIESDVNVPKRIVQWKNQLLDLSLSNRLINFRIERASYVQIPIPKNTLHQFEDLLNQAPLGLQYYPSDDHFEVMSYILMDRGEVADFARSDIAGLLAQAKVFAHVKPDRYIPVLRKIIRTAKNIVDQTGVNQLYLALGSLVWSTDAIKQTVQNSERQKQDGAPSNASEANDTPPNPVSSLKPGEIRSPLLLIPITIKSVRRNEYAIVLDESSPVMPNFSLLEKLSRELKFELPKLRNPEQDDHGIDVKGMLDHVKARLAEESLPFRVDETCVIGFFDFGNYRLWRDLSDNWQHYMKNPLINHMVTKQNQSYPPQSDAEVIRIDLDELASELPIPADSSQLDAIRRALAKQTYVLQGPPGTGKSQTIANLIFAALRRNMSVLFVTEKSTAAKVVYDRLAGIKDDADQGVETMVLDIHDQDSKPEAVKRQILRAIDANISGDKTGYDVQKRTYDQAIHFLKAYPERLHKIGNFGYSLYSARDRLLALPQTELIPLPARFYIEGTRNDVERIIESLKNVQDTAANVGDTNRNPWNFIGRSIGIATLTPDFSAELRAKIETIYRLTASLASTPATQRVLSLIGTRDELNILHMITNPVAINLELVKFHTQPEQTINRQQIIDYITKVRDYDLGPIQLTDNAIDIVFSNLFDELDKTKNSFIWGRDARIAQAQQNIVKYLARGNFLNYATSADLLAAIGDQQQTAKQLRDMVRSYANLDLPRDWNPLNREHIEMLESAIAGIVSQVVYVQQRHSVLSTTIQQSVLECTAAEKHDLCQFSLTIEELLQMLNVDSVAIVAWCATQSLVQKMRDAIVDLYYDAVQQSFLLLQRWAKFVDSVQILYRYEMVDFARGVLNGTYSFHAAINMFERSFLTEHINRLVLEANLNTFDGAAHDADVNRFRSASDQVRSHISGLASEEMLNHRRDFVQVNNNAVNDLSRDLQRSRKQLKVRQLLSRHSQVIRMLMPCTIASPNSIAMLLDISSTPYDVVIFDEASQIRVTSAICGIGRAECAIIVGDSKQMPPTSIAEKALFDETDDIDETTVYDEESILSECVITQVPSQTLTWHYRSANEMLIAFSNTAYYDGKLSAFPSPQQHAKSVSAVSFVRVQGQFIRSTTDADKIIGGRPVIKTPDGKTERKATKNELLNTNPIEAKAIYEHVVKVMNDPATADLSVGILTFNEKQADLIDSMIKADGADPVVSERFGEEYKDGATRGFIKSLETIQGDEADIILFSVAFSKNEQNKLPLNFGPLTRTGGERRLNVAVTRARKQVVVFCSFDPSELRVEDTASRGIKDLRDYLVLAKDGPEASSKTNTRRHTVDRHRDQIAQTFRDAGLDVRTDVGLTDFKIDIVITDPAAPSRCLGILLDGPRWRNRATVVDRDVFPIDMLVQRMGWHQITRIWLPMWMRNPESEKARIFELFANLPIPAPEPIPEPEPIVEIDPESEVLEPITLPEPVTPPESVTPPEPVTPPELIAYMVEVLPWTPWQQREVGDKSILDKLSFAVNKASVIALINEIIATEAPIKPSRLAKFVGGAHGLSKVTESRSSELLGLKIPNVERDKEGFLYPHNVKRMEYTGLRAGDRNIDEICLPELGNAMVYLLREQNHLKIDQLLSMTVRLFGGMRVTEGIRNRLLLALKSYRQLKRLAIDDDVAYVKE